MQQVTLANGKLYGALDTALTIRGTNLAAAAAHVPRWPIGAHASAL